jgi:hypothetical protein
VSTADDTGPHSRLNLATGEAIDIAITADGLVSVQLPVELLRLSADEAQSLSAVLGYCSGLAVTKRKRHLRLVADDKTEVDE